MKEDQKHASWDHGLFAEKHLTINKHPYLHTELVKKDMYSVP